MTAWDGPVRRMLVDLLASSHLMPLESLPESLRRCAPPAGFPAVLVYVSDLELRSLRLVTGKGADAGQEPGDDPAELRIDGTLAGRTYQTGEVLPAGPVQADGVRAWWVPMLNGTERLGVLKVCTSREDDRVREDADALAALTALVVVSKRDRSDSYARLTRTEPMAVGAEMQWHLMPPRTYADGRVVIAAALEPAYQVSGDAYDYATSGTHVHLSIFDAMGHDTAAGLTANLAMATCRNSRRQGCDLVETSERIEADLIEQFQRRRYATGILADLNTDTGVLTFVNRGHHLPLIIRAGRWTSRLRCEPAHPMGTDLGLPVHLCREQLEPGDRVVLYTDGITEARRAGGPEFGLARFVELLIRYHADGLPVPETLRRVVHAVLDHHQGQLQDDATVLFCEWLGTDTRPSAHAAHLTGLPPEGFPTHSHVSGPD
ncbi:PP2C family protein-serine/threonine phosphatase [Streptacidiphilus jiangxiensis]|uniref:Stage II sporulation protein E (SpoIIE) n=1 Tax=Streptacidiphilus jiangxiensis TaxID=235985 RepID=A0A1H7HB44_STRJI|nr:PP2C family protein-serine/threonine phosphatase [Streptacidiphilus jiangxiensis]SEK47616.1 Stage II sporulation protein E (SpoIIE) [Streptacidiphilus jiangxiensis]